MQWRKFTRLKTSATGHSRCKAMLCCGRRKDNGRSVPDLTASPGRPAPGPMQSNQHNSNMQMQRQGNAGGLKEPVLIQGDFRKVSGISSEIFRQIETVENDHDPSTAAALDAVERRGEMIVRVLEPRCIGSRQSYEVAQRFLAKADSRHTVQIVEIVKRPGQTLGLYIREGNGSDRSDGVFISRIALESAVYNSGCLRVSDEILAVNLVDVTKMSLDDVVIIMSIPRRLVLAIRTRRGRSSSPPQMSQRSEQQKPPVVVIKRDIREEQDLLDESDHMSQQHRPRSSRERRTGDGREMNESRSRLGLGLQNYSPQSEQIDMSYGYNSRMGMNADQHTPSWGYKAPPGPGVITEQPKGAQFQHSQNYYQNAGTLESLAEKVHSFYPTPNRRMSDTRAGVPLSQSHQKFPRSGSADILPRVEYTDYASSLGRSSLQIRSNLKSGAPIATGGTLGRYGRYEQQQQQQQSSRNAIKYSSPASSASLSRLKPQLDYSSDTEATIGGRQSYYYYNQQQRPGLTSTLGGRGSTAALGGGPDFSKFNSLPRDRGGLGGARLNLRSRLAGLGAEDDGNLSAPEFSLPSAGRGRSGLTTPSIFTSDEYRAWLRRAPSSSAICEQMRASRDILNQQRAQRFSCSAENIPDALRTTSSIYSNRAGLMGFGTLDRNTMGLGVRGGLLSMPVRSLSSQHIGGSQSAIRSPNIRRMRQLLELSAGTGNMPSPGNMSGHQSPAPTPSTTLPRNQRQIDINPAEFAKYKLDKPMVEAIGVSGMLWFNLLAGRGLRATPEGVQTAAAQQVRDLYCVLECDRVHKARTVVRSGDLQFDWDETFELDLVNNKQLDVLVYSWDPQHRHKLCYRGAISIPSLIRHSPVNQLALKVEPRGTIYIRLRYSDPMQLYRRRGIPAIRGNAASGLFGIDLETIVTREAKGAMNSAPVPIILRRCIEEIERRGLDIIGLYRLCGSATKKRLLRDAFERNSRAVDLSPEHVPDINVITGVLKDYLRELPEPLFTRCLFQMTVDALAVCLPDDPEGNAKLMLSILDCLPRANRATLVFLLDHLSLVVSASDRNKMSAQALATALGPPLMLHSSGNATDEVDHAQPIAVLKYLLQIWPQPQSASAAPLANSNASGMHRHGEQPLGQRGNKANALQAAKQPAAAATTPTSLARTQHSAIANNPPYQSAVAQLAQSRQVLQPVAQTSQPLAVSSASLAVPGQSAQPAIPSPSSSSGSTSSEGTGSGTETVKHGGSPTSISEKSDKTTVQQDSIRNNSNSNNNSNNADQQSKAVTSSSFSSTTAASNRNNKSSNDDFNPKRTSADVSSNGLSSSKTTASSIQAYDKPTFSKPDLVSTTSSSSGYKPFSSINTNTAARASPSPIDRFRADSINLDDLDMNSVAGRLINSSSIASFDDEMCYITPACNEKPTKTVKVRTNDKNGTTTVTNNFKLPPFPVYIPSSDIPSLVSSRVSSRCGSISNFPSKLNSPDPSSSSGTTAFNNTLSNRLSALASSSSSSHRSSSPSRSNNYSTSTLPLHLGRNNPYLYHSESNSNATTNVTSTTTSSSIFSSSGAFSSSSNPTTTASSKLSQQSNYNSIYSTLPKTTSSYVSKFESSNGHGSGDIGRKPASSSPFSKYSSSSDYYSNLSSTTTTNNSSTNGSSTYSNSNHNVFKVQYSATNPFLDELNAKSTPNEQSSDSIGSSLFRNSVSETRKKFEKLESGESLK